GPAARGGRGARPAGPAAVGLRRPGRRGAAMSAMLDPRAERVQEALKRLQLTHLREALPAVLSAAAPASSAYLESLDQVLGRELDAKQAKRVRMGLQVAHFPGVRTLEGFDFAVQPSVDERLVRELALGHFLAHGQNVLLFGPPGVGKPRPA